MKVNVGDLLNLNSFIPCLQKTEMKLFLQKSTKCFDHTQLTVDTKPEDQRKTNDETIVLKSDKKKDACVCKDCGAKKRNVSISSQLKTIHNKSEGHKHKECGLRENTKKSEVIPNMSLAEHILMKTF